MAEDKHLFQTISGHIGLRPTKTVSKVILHTTA